MVKQMLLRVPEELHGRLVERARQEGRSVNALANELIDAHLADEPTTSRHVLRARARARGVLAPTSSAAAASVAERVAAMVAATGGGPILDQLLADGR